MGMASTDTNPIARASRAVLLIEVSLYLPVPGSIYNFSMIMHQLIAITVPIQEPICHLSEQR
jgi:hypothetical protein